MDATVDKDIILAGDLICFPVSHLYFFVGGWGCLDPQTGWGHDRIFLLGSTLNECNREIAPQTEPTIFQKDSNREPTIKYASNTELKRNGTGFITLPEESRNFIIR